MANKQQWIAIDGKRYNLASMVNLHISDPNYGTGIKLESVHLMPRSKRLVVETYSIWENQLTHACYGQSFVIIDPTTDEGFMMVTHLIKLAEGEAREKLLELLPVSEDSL